MRTVRHLTAFLALLLAAGAACAQARDGAWVSYRDAYRMMVLFEKYGGSKSLIQNELEVVPAERGASAAGLQLTLQSRTTQLHLPLDATGRAVFPLHKAAYDENAALVLPNGGPFTVRARVTVAPRADGVYPAAELRSACEQALGYARYVDARARARQCAGVRFVFPKKSEAAVRVRRADGAEAPLPVSEGLAFAGDSDAGFPSATWRFGDERAQLLTLAAPLAIVPLFEQQ